MAASLNQSGFSFDELESRMMRSVTLASGGLTISATNNNDVVMVGMNDDQSKYWVTVNNSQPRYFKESDVRYVRAFLLNGNDRFQAANIVKVPIVIDGGNGNDTLEGGGGGDSLYGGNGNDILYGKGGANFLSGGDGSDTVSYEKTYGGQSVFVTLDGKANDGVKSTAPGPYHSDQGDNVWNDCEKVIGTQCDDYLIGSNADESFVGGKGNDTIFGMGGRDFLAGGEGKDLLDGGAGDDNLQGEAGTDNMFGGPGSDNVDYSDDYHSSLGRGVFIQLADSGTTNDSGIPGENDRLHDDIENVYGSQFDDKIYGNSKPNVMYGLSGNDYIWGGDGNDFLSGDFGIDTLVGYGGNDVLFSADFGTIDRVDGGDGNDLLQGDQFEIMSGIEQRITL